MQATRSRYSLVLLLLTVHQLLAGTTANHHHKSVHKSSLTSVKPDSNAVNEKEEENTAKDVAHYNFTHTDRDVAHYNFTQPAGDVAQHNVTHTADMDTGSGSPHVGSGDMYTGSGSPHVGSGDMYTGSGSPHVGSGDMYTGSGSPHVGSGDMYTGSGSPHVGSGDNIDNNITHWNGRSTLPRAEGYRHVISDTANLTSEWGNLTDTQQAPGRLGNGSHPEAYRTPQPTLTDPGTRHTDSRSPDDSMSESPSRNNQLSHVTQPPPAGGAQAVNRAKSTIKDWFLRLTKRFNSPSWLVRQLDTFAGASTNETRPISADSESAVNPSHTRFPEYNNAAANGGGNWTRQWPQVGLSDSRLAGLSDSRLKNKEDKFAIDAYEQESEYAQHKSLDNRKKDNADKLLETEFVNQYLLDPRMNVSEQTHLPAVDNSSISANFRNDKYFNSTADNALGALPKCQSCRGHALSEDRVKGIRLNMFKNLLAQKLRRDPHSLSPTSGSSLEQKIPIIPESLVEQMLRDNARQYERGEFHARDQEIIIAGEDMGRDCIKLHVTGCYSFRLKGRFQAEVAEAQLWLYKMEDPGDITGQTFTLYELERLKSGRLTHSSMIASVDTLTTQGWVVLNITRSLMKWLDKRKGTKVVAIRCLTCVSRGHRALYGAKHGYKPLLVARFLPDKGRVRDERSTSCDPRYECCKRELVVNFNDIGLVEILQPKQLSVGYCFGECNEFQRYRSNHTAIRHRLLWSEPLSNSMRQQLKPCCVPAVLKDITILTSDGDGSIVVKLLTKVVVETCGCL